MGKPLYIIPLATLILMVAAVATPKHQIEAQDEGECIEMPANDIGEGWTKIVCTDGPDKYISPSGRSAISIVMLLAVATGFQIPIGSW